MRGSSVTAARSCLQPLVSASRYLAVHALPGDPLYFVVDVSIFFHTFSLLVWYRADDDSDHKGTVEEGNELDIKNFFVNFVRFFISNVKKKHNFENCVHYIIDLVYLDLAYLDT